MAVVTFTTRGNLVGGNPENIADVTDCLDKLLTGVNNIESANVVDASLTDSDLASPNNSVWHTYRSVPWALFGDGILSGNYWFKAAGTLVPSGSSDAAPPSFRVPSASEYVVAGKTAQGRVVVHWQANAVVMSGLTATFGLYPISGVGGSGVSTLNVSLGTVVSGSTIAIPFAASVASQVNSSAFTLPNGSSYLLGAALSGTTPANSCVGGMIDLQVRFA